MSRLPPTRWARILIWTGAAGAWGTIFATTVLEPARAPAPEPATPAVAPAGAKQALPAAPADGLVVLRYRQEAQPLPEAGVITVSRTAPAPAPAPVQAAPPAPTSSGS